MTSHLPSSTASFPTSLIDGLSRGNCILLLFSAAAGGAAGSLLYSLSYGLNTELVITSLGLGLGLGFGEWLLERQ